MGAFSAIWWLTSTAPPVAIAAVQTTAATLQAVAVARPPPATAAPAPPPPAAALAPPAAEPPRPISLAANASGPTPTGASAANERRMPRSAPRYSRAAVARAHVLAGAAGGLDALVVRAQQVGLDLDAVGVAGLGGLHQAHASADEEGLDRGDRHVERVGEVGVGHAVHLAHQERGALLLRELADVGDELAQVVAALGLLDRVVQRLAGHVEDLGRRRDRTAQMIDAAVVGDAVQPRPHVHLAVVVAQRPVRADEDVLQHVLRVLARAGGEHLAHVGEQPLAIAVVEHPEGLVVAATECRDQLLIRTQSQQPTAEWEAVQCCGGVYR